MSKKTLKYLQSQMALTSGCYKIKLFPKIEKTKYIHESCQVLHSPRLINQTKHLKIKTRKNESIKILSESSYKAENI